MQISALEEYGLRCALQLASLKEGETLAASQIAEREGISIRYASKILHLFRRSGMVSSQRGIQGGFRLSKGAETIAIKEVFGALHPKPKKSGGFCNQYKGLHQECVHLSACSVKPIWEILGAYFDGVLEQISIADLARTEASSRKKVEVFARSEAERLRSLFLPAKSAGLLSRSSQ